MAVSDPIADMLTRIRNASSTRAKTVKCLNSKVCRGIAEVMREEGYIDGFDVIDDGRQGHIRVKLKYGPSGESLMRSLRRASAPGRRLYSGVESLPKPLQGLGIAIVSTSRGVMSDRKCRKERVGGEVLCVIE